MQGSAFDQKYVAFIVSGGRTGTTFFGDLLSKVIDDSFSVHEPDIFDGFNARTWQGIKRFGIYHMIIGRALGKTGIRNLTQNYLGGRIDDQALVAAIRKHREKYYAGINQSYIIESYFQWYGILPALPQVFPHYKVIGLIRDPRTWVRSWINFQGLFDEKDRVAKFGAQRLNPAMVGDVQYAARWNDMSVFEKLCWQWAVVTRTLQNYAAQDDHIRLFRYEDLFLADNRASHVGEMLEFLTQFPGKTFDYHLDPALLQTVKNPSAPKKLGPWPEWPDDLCRQLNNICGPYMGSFKYGVEPEWKARP